jgi:hypothetical protein
MNRRGYYIIIYTHIGWKSCFAFPTMYSIDRGQEESRRDVDRKQDPKVHSYHVMYFLVDHALVK